MATTRTPISRPTRARITPEAVMLYRQLVALLDDPDAVDQWEETGGKRRAVLDISSELQRRLGRQLWEACVDDTIGSDEPPEWMVTQPDRVDDWSEARSLRVALDAAIAE